jgi:predicted MFS family arabinose efflux permease
MHVATAEIPQNGVSGSTPWNAVICLSLLTFVLVASEFMPVSLLTPIAGDLGITEGQAGQAIAISGFFAVITSLFGNSLLAAMDRRSVVFLYTVVLLMSGLAVAFAPNYLVFMIGRALVGVSVGGFWSLSTAILARIVPERDLAKAIALLQGGTAFATVIAAPAGSFLGGIIGWRGAFFLVVPVGLAALVWQMMVLPKLPAGASVSVGSMFRLLLKPVFAVGMAATALAFMGQFSLSTYLRPFLEAVTGLDVNSLSLVLLGVGVAGLAGTSLIGFLLRSHLAIVLVALPAILSVVALVLIGLGSSALPTAMLLLLWGLCSTPIAVAWNTWMTRIIPNDLEAGGGLQVALIQFSITFGAFAGGILFDTAGWWSPMMLASVLLLASAGLSAIIAMGSKPLSSAAS